MKARALLVTAVLCVFLAGCSHSGRSPGTYQAVGGVMGAVLGGLLGSQLGSGGTQLAMTSLGSSLGGVLGAELGLAIHEAELTAEDEARDRATNGPTGEPVLWKDPDSGASGSVTPLRDVTSSAGERCREFEQKMTVAGRTETTRGVACLGEDGVWKVVH